MDSTFSLQELFGEFKTCVDANKGTSTYCYLTVNIGQHRNDSKSSISLTYYWDGGPGHVTVNTARKLMDNVRNYFSPENKEVTADVTIPDWLVD